MTIKELRKILLFFPQESEIEILSHDVDCNKVFYKFEEKLLEQLSDENKVILWTSFFDEKEEKERRIKEKEILDSIPTYDRYRVC